ncbi:MAG: hypothetical protein P4L92_17540 [Rudaea sp.]|nr:hypothetical protein [Rudaea sp.]
MAATTAIAAGSHAAAPDAAVAAKDPAADIATLDPVFDCFRMNTAWGFALAGTLIDSHGNIYRYSMRGKGWAPATTQADGVTYLHEADLRAKFALAQRTGSVDAAALAENSALIARAAEGRIERTDTGTRDAGASTCHAYVHDEAQKRYRDIELGSDGGVSDMRDINTAVEARSLLAWLASVGVAR